MSALQAPRAIEAETDVLSCWAPRLLALCAGTALAQTRRRRRLPARRSRPPRRPPRRPRLAPAAQTPPRRAATPPKPFPEGAKIAYVNIQAIASNSVEGKAATAKLDELRKKKTAEIAEKNKALAGAQTKLQQGGVGPERRRRAARSRRTSRR